MTRILAFPPRSRLLVFAPHPDDETLATGELIQLALAAGAEVRVVFATDGDNNPWPQRWVERRWSIDSGARARWGARRRSEAEAALATLGAPAGSVRFLGWPDLGLTRALEQDDAAIATLAAEIAAFAPTHTAMPSLHDRHPDHGALRVLVELALDRARAHCERLGYVVHGREAESGDWRLPRDAGRQRRKVDALMAHTSQISLSRKRLLRWANAPETFERAEAGSSIAIAAPAVLRIPLVPAYRFWRRHDLLLIVADGERVARARVPLPQLVEGTDRVLAHGACDGCANVELAGGALRIAFPGIRDGVRGYIKLERTEPRLMIFDAEPWRRIEDLALAPDVATVPVKPVPVAQRASL
jgi:LmbE family N-acetylglucosaminyl deacetylase